ncbi:MAG: dienelactone hydrolase family protein [Pseudomonadales bacterium]
MIEIQAADGFQFQAYANIPAAPKGAIVVIQEIFGVNAHIREVVDGYAAAGYAAVAPALFDRIEPGIELGYDEAGMGRGIALAFQELDHEHALLDLQAAINHISAHGKVGVVGYCFGGLLTWRSACLLDGVSAASSYYGGGVPAESARKAQCPVIAHFGEQDEHIPMADVKAFEAAQPAVTVYAYAADHGFNCDHRGSYNATAASQAKARTLEFFDSIL